ncbi:uncharacterized protein [Rutidosis leptorrhynchoides]|uniref:uncharacterized protein n=1 Tax=Rutidosis leptorrhynchoides TaxID=125765 RepID=UPI003A99536C
MSETPKYHPALSISNIKHLIPVILDIKDAEYNSWAHLFKIHCRAYHVIHHILPPPATSEASTVTTSNNNDPLWSSLDVVVLQWIYGTISKELMRTIMEEDQTAAQA